MSSTRARTLRAVPFVFVPASAARDRVAVSALVLGLVSTSTISPGEVVLG
jgi:hypothetical protein